MALPILNLSKKQPPISIPALESVLGRQTARPVQASGSSISYITPEKLERSRAELQAAYEEMCAAQNELENALEELQEGEIDGYDILYTEEAMENYTKKFTDEYVEAEDMAKVKIEELIRLQDFDEL